MPLFRRRKGIFDAYDGFARASKDLLAAVRVQADVPLEKIRVMQEIYLSRNSALYRQDEIRYLKYYLNALSYKFHLANLSLEHMWGMSHNKRGKVLVAIENGLDRLDCSDDEEFLSSFILESFLFQGNAFLDFYMLYLCLFLRTGHEGKMSSKERFYKELSKTKREPFRKKAEKVRDYFNTNVFGPAETSSFNRNDWGSLLRSLRDKIAHRDRLRPSFGSEEKLIGGILFDWPTLQGMTYDRFCQDMDNGMFIMLQEISSIIYELEWKAGHYHPNMWNNSD